MELLDKFQDIDGTEKSVFRVDKGIIEVTTVKNKRYKEQEVYCLPTHHYCNLGCKFCHLTEENDKLDMRQVYSDDLIEALKHASTQNYPRVLLSFMGVGEPLLNTKLILETYDRMHRYWNDVSMALSTMMPCVLTQNFMDNIEQKQIPLKIHFSLHSSIDKIRQNIIPSTKVTIEKALNLLVDYRNRISNHPEIEYKLGTFHSSESPVLLHYTIIDGINDSDEELKQLVNIGQIYHIPLKIIKFNPNKQLKRSRREQIWIKVLEKNYYAPVKFYEPPGANIGSSCGQFTKHYYISCDDDEEFELWKNKYQIK